MIESVNNTLPIKQFRVETKEWRQFSNTTTEFNDHTIFDIVRGTLLWDRFQEFVSRAIVGDERPAVDGRKLRSAAGLFSNSA